MTVGHFMVESTGALTELDKVKLSGRVQGHNGSISWAGNALAIITGTNLYIPKKHIIYHISNQLCHRYENKSFSYKFNFVFLLITKFSHKKNKMRVPNLCIIMRKYDL